MKHLELFEKKPSANSPYSPFPVWFYLAAATLLIIGILIVLLVWFIIFTPQIQQNQDRFAVSGKIGLRLLTQNAGTYLLQNDDLNLMALVDETVQSGAFLYAFIVKNNGLIKAHSDHRMIGKPFDSFPNIDDVSIKNQITYTRYSQASRKQVLNLSKNIVLEKKKLGEVHVGMIIASSGILIQFERLFLVLLACMAIIFTLFVVLLHRYFYLRPFEKLIDGARKIIMGNYKIKIETGVGGKPRKLAEKLNTMSDQLWEKSLMQVAFGKYVGPKVLDIIKANPQSTWIKGQRREATILFTDIRKFTSFSEKREPEIVLQRLNDHFEIVIKAILQYDGYIDKFLGDAVLCVFGVPIDCHDHMERAVRAAVYLQKELDVAKREGGKQLPTIGIGIDSGVVVSGNVGSQAHMEYTIIGDCVNTASRLSDLAGAGEIIISQRIYDQLSDIVEIETLPFHSIKGKSIPSNMYKVKSIK